ncbi:dnaJ homolog subfamily C member 11-like, partial [Lampetra fluviatilis]
MATPRGRGGGGGGAGGGGGGGGGGGAGGGAGDLRHDEEGEADGDFYSTLNVRREATQEELKSAYRRLCVTFHPDKHRRPEDKEHAEGIFNRIHTAYQVLSDPQSRAIYDIYGKRGLEMDGWE